MPTLPSRETLRTIFSNPAAVRAERHRRRVRSGTDRDLLAFVEETFGVRIPAVACCPGHVAPAQAFSVMPISAARPWLCGKRRAASAASPRCSRPWP